MAAARADVCAEVVEGKEAGGEVIVTYERLPELGGGIRIEMHHKRGCWTVYLWRPRLRGWRLVHLPEIIHHRYMNSLFRRQDA